MLVVPLIERKRDGGTLTPEEWSALVAAYTADRIPDYQMSALLMAVVLRGLERQELAALTDAMLASGQRLAFDSWGTPRVDKHSTGGVGDKVSLVLAPPVAACGVGVPVVAGRGLGHTGGRPDPRRAAPVGRCPPPWTARWGAPRQRARNRRGDPRAARGGACGSDGGDLRPGRRDAARCRSGEDLEEGAPPPRERTRVGARRREVRARDRGARWQPQGGRGCLGASPSAGGGGVQRAAHGRGPACGPEDHRPGGRRHGRGASRGGRYGGSHGRVRDHGEAGRQDPGGRADRLGVREGSGGDQARVRGAAAGDRGRGQARRKAVAVDFTSGDEGRRRAAEALDPRCRGSARTSRSPR